MTALIPGPDQIEIRRMFRRRRPEKIIFKGLGRDQESYSGVLRLRFSWISQNAIRINKETVNSTMTNGNFIILDSAWILPVLSYTLP